MSATLTPQTTALADGYSPERWSRTPDILPNVYELLASGRMSLADIEWEQHRFHERRRWNAVELVDRVNLSALTEADKIYILNFAHAELTTKPGADRLARDADAECRRWQGVDDHLAETMQAIGTWSRYWNEEESHHEAALAHLVRRLDFEPISNEMFLEYRTIFPKDDMLRALFIMAISEVKTVVMYTSMANKTDDEGLKVLFRQIATDEAQHMRYFNSFGRALVTSGRYSPRGAFAMAEFFLREGGDLEGYARPHKEKRETINWWDQLDFRNAERPDDFERQHKLTYVCLEQMTGIKVSSPQEVQETWLELVG